MFIKLDKALKIIEGLKIQFKYFTVVGSIKRREDIINDMDLLIRRKYIDGFIKSQDIITIEKKNLNNYKGYILINGNRLNVDIFICDDDNYFFAKFMYESPKKYNIRIRRLAKLKGYKLTQYGLFKLINGVYISIPIKNRKELTTILGITNRNIYERD